MQRSRRREGARRDEDCERPGKDNKEEPKKDEKKEEPPKPIKVDLAGIETRVAPVPIASGIYSNLAARKGKLFYMAQPPEARAAGTAQDNAPRNIVHVYDLEKREDKELLTRRRCLRSRQGWHKVIYKAGPVYGIQDAEPGKAKVGEGKLDLSGLQVKIDPREEWKQIFHEAWRIERDFYWDPAMTGHNWEQIGKRYEALLPWVAHRSDLNYLIGEMIAELSTSHTYVGGGDQPQRSANRRGPAGRRFPGLTKATIASRKSIPAKTGAIPRVPLSPSPGLKAKAGDYLIAVNGAARRNLTGCIRLLPEPRRERSSP